MFRQLEAWMTEHTGYPTVSGYDEFLYEPDKPLHGDLTDYAYNQRGALAYVIELWDLFKRARHGAPAEVRRSTTSASRAPTSCKLAWWDNDENEGRCFPPWRPFEHPQLGAVEIGGIDPRIGIWNPPLHELAAVCATQAQVFLRVAALAPRLRIARTDRHALAGGVDARRSAGRERGLPRHLRRAVARRSSTSTSRSTRPRDHGCELVDPGTRAPGARPPRRLGPRPAHRREPAGLSGHARHDERRVGDATSCKAAARSRCAIGCGSHRIRDRCASRSKTWRCYAIGDIQGCMASLERLLALIDFSPPEIGCGSSVISSIAGRARSTCCAGRTRTGPVITCVLGNHDIHLLARAAGAASEKKRDTLDDVLSARDPIADRLAALAAARPRRRRPRDGPRRPSPRLDSRRRARAGQPRSRRSCAAPTWRAFLAQLKRPVPRWDRQARRRRSLARDPRVLDARAHAQGRWPRRARLQTVHPRGAPAGEVPWFKFPDAAWTTHTVVFGHWAALGLDIGPHHIALDTGCVWGKALTAMRLDDRMVFQVKAVEAAT